MMEEMPVQKKKISKKTIYIIAGVAITILIVILLLVFNKKDEEDKVLIIEAIISEDYMSSYSFSPQNNSSQKVILNAPIQLASTNYDEEKYDIEYFVSDSNIARIDDDKVIGLTEGTVSIYAVIKDKDLTSNTINITFE